MVFTRRRSAVLQEDVNAAMEAMDAAAPPRRAKRLSEVGSESSVTSRTRSPRVSTSSSTSKTSTENKHLAAALSSELGLSAASPAARIRSPRTSASSKASEAAAPDSRPSTPTRGVAARLTEGGRPGTPTRLKRLSESMSVTPTRKSRRLSGSAPEEVDNTVVLPLKKRRASIGLAEENTRENEPTESEPTNDTELTTLESNLEVIDEKEEDEISPKKKNTTPAKTPSKTPENKSSKKTSASSRQTPKESAKPTPDKSPKKESEKSSKTPTKATTPKKTGASPKVVVKDSSGDEYETAKESLASSVDENDQTIQAEQASIEVDETEQEVFAEGKDSKQVEEMATEMVEKLEKAVDKENEPTIMTEEEILRRIALSLVKTIPRQKCKSGRFWKSERSHFGSLKRDAGKKLDLDRKLKLKEEKERNRDEANALIIAKNKKKEEFRLKIEEAKKRKAENRRRAEVVQIVKNPNKIKKMKKKDLVRRDILTK